MSDNATAARPSLSDQAIRMLVRFFSADWSGALLAVVVLAIGIELVTEGKPFFHPSNIMTILNNSASLGIVAAGMTLVILTAGIDLSVGSVMGLCAALTGYVASYWGFPPVISIFFGLGVGLCIGLIHGTLVARFGMPAFIVTLAGLSIWRGTGHLATNAQATPKLAPLFDYFGRFNPLAGLRHGFKEASLPDFLMPVGKLVDSLWMEHLRTFQMSLIIFIVFYIALSTIIHNTKMGRYTYAIGSNEQGARQAGIDVRLYKTLAYVTCSMTAALAAIMFLGRAPYAKSDYGMMWELDAIAAVVIGGTSLFGGRGSIWGTFLGVILLKLINNGLTLAQLETFWQMVVTGLIILVAVGIDIVRQNANRLRVRQLMLAIGTVMMIFAFIAPGSQVLKSAVHVVEHSVAVSLKEERTAMNKTIAPTQQQRIMTEERLAADYAAIKAHSVSAALFAGLAIFAGLSIAGAARQRTIILIGLYAIAAVYAQFAGYASAIPFIVLGLVTLLGSLTVDHLFTRARALDVIE